MWKFLLVGLIFSQSVQNIFCKAIVGSTDTIIEEMFPSMTVPKSNDTDGKPTLSSGKYNFHAIHQTFYFNVPSGGQNRGELRSDDIGKKIRSDYTVTNGIGAHKFHRRKLSWNKARHVCIDEGGHLAVVRSEAEEKVIRQMMQEESCDHAWIGFHDKYEEGDWVTVLDEPIGKIPWAPWSKVLSVNPDNAGGNEHCACLLAKQGGINDDNCTKELPFVCKISID